jgi:hypothetical protein
MVAVTSTTSALSLMTATLSISEIRAPIGGWTSSIFLAAARAAFQSSWNFS